MPDDFAARFGSTGRSSMPSASWRSQSAMAADRLAQQRSIGGAHVDQPLDAALAQSRRGHRPTPHSASTGSCCRNGSTRSGAITVRPSGFFQPEAIFARNLFGATPADAVSPVAVADLAP